MKTVDTPRSACGKIKRKSVRWVMRRGRKVMQRFVNGRWMQRGARNTKKWFSFSSSGSYIIRSNKGRKRNLWAPARGKGWNVQVMNSKKKSPRMYWRFDSRTRTIRTAQASVMVLS